MVPSLSHSNQWKFVQWELFSGLKLDEGILDFLSAMCGKIKRRKKGNFIVFILFSFHSVFILALAHRIV